jgi:hypothetical protein
MTEHKAAVRRVIARGSDPAAIAEAEGDFGPGGTFAEPVKFYLDNAGRLYIPPAWVDTPGVDIAELTTTELHALLSTTHLTREQLRAIRAEIDSRRI